MMGAMIARARCAVAAIPLIQLDKHDQGPSSIMISEQTLIFEVSMQASGGENDRPICLCLYLNRSITAL